MVKERKQDLLQNCERTLFLPISGGGGAPLVVGGEWTTTLQGGWGGGLGSPYYPAQKPVQKLVYEKKVYILP